MPDWAEYAIVDAVPLARARRPSPATSFGDDYIAGGAGDDVIFGQLGDDMIQGDGAIEYAARGRVAYAARDGRPIRSGR